MRASQQLLADYAETGSESAFREVVERYLSLVYSTALRLMEGDAAAAEDVTQTVFLHLARRAHQLGREPLLGGWLHRDTCFVAAKALRREHRRQAREREAVLMNAVEDHAPAHLAALAPVLDEAINQLGAADRTAVLLRFFEQRDFQAVGAALGSTEDAARMRVNRALEKLQGLLRRRGVTLSVTALGTLLAAEAVSAAPAGLAAGVTGAVLASSAGGGIGVTLLKLITMTKLHTSIVSAVVVAGVATTLVVQHQARGRLRVQEATLQQQSAQLAQLGLENQRLSNLVAQQQSTRDTLGELPKLRAEATALRGKTNSLPLLRAAAQSSPAAGEAAPKTPLAEKEENLAKMIQGKDWMAAFHQYAEGNGGRYPASFEEAARFLADPARAKRYGAGEEFEIVYHGTREAMTNFADGIVLREKQPRKTSDGKWVRVYGFADGHSQLRASADGNFDAFEQEHLAGPPAN